MAKYFNNMVSMDVEEIEGMKFLLLVDMAANYMQDSWLINKTLGEKYWKNIVFGPPECIFSDN